MSIHTVFLVSSFNRFSLLVEACDNIIGFLNRHKGYGLLILDAGSTDGSVEHIKSIIQKNESICGLFENDQPSFSEGVNRMFLAIKTFFPEANFGLLFETDNLILNDQPVLDSLVLMSKIEKIGAVGFTIQSLQGKALIPGSTFIKTIATILGLQISDKLRLERIKLSYWQSCETFQWQWYEVLYTSPLLVRINSWEETGGMDAEKFPFAESDVHWAWKLSQKGYKQAIINSTGIVHDNRSTLSSWSTKRVYEVHKRRLLYIKEVKGGLVAMMIMPLIALRHIFEAAYFLIVKKDKKRFKARYQMILRVFQYYP